MACPPPPPPPPEASLNLSLLRVALRHSEIVLVASRDITDRFETGSSASMPIFHLNGGGGESPPHR